MQKKYHISFFFVTIFYIVSGVLMLFCSCSAKANSAVSHNREYYIDWATKIADSEISRNPELWMADFQKKPKWDYTQGLIAKAMLQVYKTTSDSTYLDYVQAFADYFIAEDGTIKTYKLEDYNLDRINGGNFLFELKRYNPQPQYDAAIELLRSQLLTQPRTNDGGFWHKKIYPSQMWLDGLYMAEPFYARYAIEQQQMELFDDIAHQFIIVDKHTKKENGLNYHGWDESKEQAWANKESGCSNMCWGRAEGWYFMAIVDVLEYMPTNHPQRSILLDILQRVGRHLIETRSNHALWYQVPDMSQESGNYEESTCSAMFCYAMAKSARLGFLDRNYLTYSQETFDSLIANKVRKEKDGTYSLTDCCAVAGLGGTPYRSGTYEYYIKEKIRDNDPKGIGPFILAAIELSKSAK